MRTIPPNREKTFILEVSRRHGIVRAQLFRRWTCGIASFTISVMAHLTLFAIVVDSAVGEDMSIAEFIDTYRAAAVKLEKKHRNIRVVGLIDSFDARGETEFRGLDDTVVRVVKAPQGKLEARGPVGPKASAQVNRFGTDYGFRLSKPEPERRYRIIDLTYMDELDTSSKEQFEFERGARVNQFLKAPMMLYGKTIRARLNDEDFQINSVRRSRSPSGKEIVEVDVSLAFPEDSELEACELTFLPNLSWVLDSYETRYTVRTAEKEVKIAEGALMTYGSASAKSNLFPDTIELYQKDSKTGAGWQYTFKTKRVEFGSVKPEELTLTAFGLRDITQTRTAPNYWLIVGLALGVPLALCGLFWVVKRRRSIKKKEIT